MALDSQDSSNTENTNEKANRLAFNFFLGALGFALLAALWMLFQATFF